MTLTVLDIAVAVLAVVLVARGIWIGFVRQIAFLAAMVLGYVAAGTYYPQVAAYVKGWIDNMQLGFLLTYALLFFVTYVLVMLGGMLLRKVMQISFLGWFDRTMGGVFGLAKAVFIATLGFMLLSAVLSTSSPLIERSISSKYLMQSARILTSIIKDHSLQQKITPRPPAISTVLSNSIPGAKLLQGNAK